jgi:hypothetical protein
VATFLDKRRRNARPSKYRPRTEAQKEQRRALRDAREADRKRRPNLDAEADLRQRLGELETALRDVGQAGVHNRRHTRPLDEIVDDAERFSVLKARVERLEALWNLSRRKRETRGKIIIGGALLAELIDDVAAGDRVLLETLLDVLDRRVEAVRDRLTVRELLGNAPLPLRPGGDLSEPLDAALAGVFDDAPDIDLMVQTAMADEILLRAEELDADYVNVAEDWRPAP